MDDAFSLAEQFLPKYLSPRQSRDLYEALKQFPDFPTFYLGAHATDDELLQGDGWRGFAIRSFGTGDLKSVQGILLSNSCDVDVLNLSVKPRRAVFAPLVSLQRFAASLKDSGLSDLQVETQLREIRSQRITDIFYLPSGPNGPEESIAILDDVHSHPLDDFLSRDRTRIFRLQMAAFYLFVIKLSIHFCRLQEGVSRFEAVA